MKGGEFRLLESVQWQSQAEANAQALQTFSETKNETEPPSSTTMAFAPLTASTRKNERGLAMVVVAASFWMLIPGTLRQEVNFFRVYEAATAWRNGLWRGVEGFATAAVDPAARPCGAAVLPARGLLLADGAGALALSVLSLFGC
jgi:hypothetical protein